MTRVSPDRSVSGGPVLADTVVDDPVRRARHQALLGEVHRGARDLPPDARALMLAPPLAALFGSRGLRGGSTVLIGGVRGHGMTSLAFGLCAGPTRDRRWVGMLNLSRASLVGATELGVALEHLVVIPHPVERVAGAASVLMEACSLLLLGSDRPVSVHDARRLQRRAREYRCVLVVLAPPITLRAGSGSSSSMASQRYWPEVPDTLIEVVKSTAAGIGRGDGHLSSRQLRVEVTHRRSTSVREVHELTFPNDGACLSRDAREHPPVHVGLHDFGQSGDDRRDARFDGGGLHDVG